MTPLDDPALRDHLARRVGASSLTAEERNHILGDVAAGRRETRPSHAWTLGGRWLGFAAAALSLILVVAVVLKPPTDRGPVASSSDTPSPAAQPGPPSASVAATAEPISAPRVFSAQELSDLVGGDRVGDVVLANARINQVITDPKVCPPPGPCQNSVLADVPARNVVAVGWRTAPEGTGTRVEDENGVRWLTRIAVPAESGLFAFRILTDAVEYLGPVVKAPDGGVGWDVEQMEGGERTEPTGDLYAVDGWLVGDGYPYACVGLPEAERADMSWYCGAGIIASESARTVGMDGEAIHPRIVDGLRVEKDAYGRFAPHPKSDELGPIPREGVYLVRSAGCQVGVEPCPAWGLVGRLDDFAPPDAIADFPSEIDGERVLTTDEALWLVANSGSAEPFLVGGRVTIHAVDCAIDPDLPVTPLLEQCDGGYRMAKERSDSWGEFRLVVEGSVSVPLREPVGARRALARSAGGRLPGELSRELRASDRR